MDGVLDHLVDGLDLGLHQVAEHLVLGEVLGDQRSGSVSAVCCAESVVHVAVGVGSQLGGECLLALLYGSLCSLLLLFGCILGQSAGLALLLCVEAEVFEQEHLSGLQRSGLCVSLLAVRGELYGNSQKLLHAGDDVLQGELVSRALGLAKVRHHYQRAAACKDLLECGNGRPDAGIVGYVEFGIEGNVEIHPDNGLLATEIVSVDSFHIENNVVFGILLSHKFIKN